MAYTHKIYNSNTLEILIFDLDGTLVDSSDRLKAINFNPKAPMEQWPKDWGNPLQDKPLIPTLKLLAALHDEFEIWIVTIRDPNDLTLKWLEKYEVFYDKIFQLGTGQNTGVSPEKIKEEWYDSLLKRDKNRINTVFEDSPKMINMFRSKGLHVCDVGQFEGSM